MADAITANYSFTLPEVGASNDTWGEKLNENWDSLDLILAGFETDKQDALGFTPVEQGGGTFMGTNKLRLGWDTATAHIRAQVDATQQGVLVVNKSAVGSAGDNSGDFFAPGNAPIYGIRAWAQVNGTSGAVVAGGNVTSVREGVGLYRITFPTPMADANYGILFQGYRNDGIGGNTGYIWRTLQDKLAGSVLVRTLNAGGTTSDADSFTIAVIR